MFKKLSDKNRKRLHRKIHIRKSIYGTAERPRLTVFKSGRNLYAQVINDDEGRTLAAISTLEKDFIALKANVESAKKLCLPYHVGVVQSKDSFFGQHAPETMPIYPELQNKWDAYCKLDCLASEMESSTVFIVSQTRHVRSGAMFLCLANQEREKAGLSNIQNHDLKPLMECAVSTLKNLIEKDEAENH